MARKKINTEIVAQEEETAFSLVIDGKVIFPVPHPNEPLEIVVEGHTEILEKIKSPTECLSTLLWLEDWKRFGFSLLPHILERYESKADNTIDRCKGSEEANDHFTVEDARDVLRFVGKVRRAVEQGDAERAAVFAMRLVYHDIRATVRQYERNARDGRIAKENLFEGRKRGLDRYNDARERHRTWQGLAATMKGSARSIAHRIALKTGDKAETIRKTLRTK